MTGDKYCNKCGTNKSVEQFSKCKTRKDGLQAYCKGCLNAQKRESRKNFPRVTEVPSTKLCTKCGTVKASEEFNRNASKRSGLQCQCKSCASTYPSQLPEDRVESRRRYYLKHREYIIAHNAAYDKSSEGKSMSRRKSHRRRGFGESAPLNKWFQGSEEHHLHIGNSNDTIFIPAELHRSIYHNSNNGTGMEEINILAFEYINNKGRVEA